MQKHPAEFVLPVQHMQCWAYLVLSEQILTLFKTLIQMDTVDSCICAWELLFQI